jgi:hypothetical protein
MAMRAAALIRSFVLAAAAILVLRGALGDARSEPAASLGCSAGSASVQQIAKITNTRDRNFHCLGVAVDRQANITAIRFETHEFDADRQSRGAAPRSVKVREFSPSDIASEKGVVLDGAPGHDAVILQGNIVEGHSSDQLVVKYLYNGLTDQFRECRVALKRGGDVGWHLVNADNRRVPLVVVETWSLPLVGTVGIKTLQGLCA